MYEAGQDLRMPSSLLGGKTVKEAIASTGVQEPGNGILQHGVD